MAITAGHACTASILRARVFDNRPLNLSNNVGFQQDITIQTLGFFATDQVAHQPMSDLIHTNSSIISGPCAGCGVLTLARILNCACVQERDDPLRLGLHEQAKNLNRSPWLGLNMTLVKQFADQCALCRMIHTEIRKAIPSDSHVLSVFKVDDREGGIAGIWFYYGFERHSVAKLCCYADEGIEKHSCVADVVEAG